MDTNKKYEPGPVYRKDRIKYALEILERARGKLDPDKMPLPSVKLAEHMMDTLLKQDGRMYAKPPTFREKPLASLLHRAIWWHGSGGNLHGVFSARWDAALLINASEKELGAYWTHKKSNLLRDAEYVKEFKRAGDLWDVIDNFALVLRGGSSPAANAWNRALSAWNRALYGG